MPYCDGVTCAWQWWLIGAPAHRTRIARQDRTTRARLGPPPFPDSLGSGSNRSFGTSIISCGCDVCALRCFARQVHLHTRRRTAVDSSWRARTYPVHRLLMTTPWMELSLSPSVFFKYAARTHTRRRTTRSRTRSPDCWPPCCPLAASPRSSGCVYGRTPTSLTNS
jgi:hypothetical protein